MKIWRLFSALNCRRRLDNENSSQFHRRKLGFPDRPEIWPLVFLSGGRFWWYEFLGLSRPKCRYGRWRRAERGMGGRMDMGSGFQTMGNRSGKDKKSEGYSSFWLKRHQSHHRCPRIRTWSSRHQISKKYPDDRCQRLGSLKPIFYLVFMVSWIRKLEMQAINPHRKRTRNAYLNPWRVKTPDEVIPWLSSTAPNTIWNMAPPRKGKMLINPVAVPAMETGNSSLFVVNPMVVTAPKKMPIPRQMM